MLDGLELEAQLGDGVVFGRVQFVQLHVLDEHRQRIAYATDGWSGAELEGLVLKAWEIAQDVGAKCMKSTDLLAACSRLSPSTADVAYMTAIAIKECNDLDLLPEGYRDVLKDRRALDDTIDKLAPAGRSKRQV